MVFHSTNQQDLLFDAARKGDIAYLKQLIEEGVDINVQNAKGFTPLILASYDEHLEATASSLPCW